MTLQLRLTIALVAVITTVVTVAGIFAVTSAERELVDGVDDFLIDRAKSIEDLQSNAEAKSFVQRDERRSVLSEFLAEPDAITQIVDPKGQIIFAFPISLPLEDAEIKIATQKDEKLSGVTRIRKSTVGGVDYRILSKPLPRGGLLQIGRDLSEVNDAISGMIRAFLLLGLIGIAIAILSAWVLASQLAKPIKRLSKTAEHVARTQELTAFIDSKDGDKEVRRLAESFNVMLRALATSRDQQKRLVTDASHELRTPLTSVRTNIELLAKAKSIDEKDKELIIRDLKTEINELSLLVDEIVNLATSTGFKSENFVTDDLSVIAQEVAQKFSRRSGRTIDITSSGDSIRDIQSTAIERAISNLVDNAIKFSPEGTDIVITVENGTVCVRDFGIGVREDDRGQLFERFFRSVDTRNLPGSGIGLSIVEEIIMRHNGHVFVKAPENGPGTEVGFTL
ncbi:MAG: HAMP domain-containing sensor histidine kinase [Actinomycetota bacterium]|nr:HAMP domain-containing sensor histidine kinase [Actinomycetota bacterium]